MFNCVFVTLPCDILGQVRYLIVSIPDLCCLSYFQVKYKEYECNTRYKEGHSDFYNHLAD